MKVLLTGLTSFTGAYIGKALLEYNNVNKFEVYAPIRSSKEAYTGLKLERLNLVKNIHLIPNQDISQNSFIDLVKEIKPDIFINHAGYIDNYRSEDFDFLKHLEINLKNIKHLIQALKDNKCKLIIHSGSAFEPNGDYSKYGVSPYGVAKKMVWDMLVFLCQKYKIPTSKIIIPNPYGLLENQDRLLAVFNQKLKREENIDLYNSAEIRNNIKAQDLADYYLKAALLALGQLDENYVLELKAIGHIETQLNFVLRSLQEPEYGFDLNYIKRFLRVQN